MAQGLAYPVSLDTQDDGSVLVSFPDIPEALTEGATEQEALAEAEDCLIAALGGTSGHDATFHCPRSRGDAPRWHFLRSLPPRRRSIARYVCAASEMPRLPNGSGHRKARCGGSSILITVRISVRSKRVSARSVNVSW